MKKLINIKSILFAGTLVFSLQSCVKDYHNPASGTPGDVITIFALKQAYQGSEVTLSKEAIGGASKIAGVVISDKTGLNVEPGTFVLQQTVSTTNSATDVTRGIILKMSSGNADYNFGDSLIININGLKLDRLNGRLTISGLTPDKVSLAGTRVPLVRYVTLGILKVNMDEYESTLISLNADVADFAGGTTFAGLRKLKDNTGPEIYLQTRNEASFSGTQVPLDAQFNGIAGYYNEASKDTASAKKVIMPRTAADIQFISGVIYPNFPESFEAPDFSAKSSYNSGTNIVALNSGSWTLLQAILANTLGSDKINAPGKQSIRMQQNLTTSGFAQMNFDVPDGASKVSVFYGKYATDAKSSFKLEYSTNQGTTWIAVGNNITDMPDKGAKQATWAVNITGPVRFRINKNGIGTTNNGRLALDDFAVYKK